MAMTKDSKTKNVKNVSYYSDNQRILNNKSVFFSPNYVCKEKQVKSWRVKMHFTEISIHNFKSKTKI